MGQVASSHLSGMGTQLIKASKAGDADAVTELVSSNPQLLRYCTFRHLGPCHYAARGDHVEVLQQLVAKAQEIEQLQGREAAASSAQVHARLVGSVPPAAAAATAAPHHQQQPPSLQRNSLVRQLVNATSDRGVTPLMLAVDGGCVASVRLLLENGADPWAVDKLGGRTALHYAARSDSPEILQLLAEAAGSSGPVQFPNRPNTSYVDVRTQTGFTAIHFAVQSNSRQALAVLLNLGANPLLSSLFDCLDVINCPKGTTALHLAARQGNEAVAKQLLRTYVEHWYQRHLPDPRLLLDGDNLLPCQVAARRNHAETARMLLPSNPITSLFTDGDLNLVGPPSLAAIAGAVLRSTLNGDLQQLLMQQRQGHDVHSAAGVQQDGEQEQHDGEQEAGDQEQQQEEQPESDAATMTAAATEAHTAEDCQSEDASVDAADDDSSSSAASSSSSDDACKEVCGVCFDEPPQVLLSPCGHQLCTGCCQSLLALNSRCVLMCPFCRAGVAHLQPAAGVVAHKAAGCGAVGCGNAAGVVGVGAPAALVSTPEPAVALTSGANQLVV